MKTFALVFKKIESEDKTKYDIFYSISKPEIIINESGIDDVFKSIYSTIIKKYKDLQERAQAGLLTQSLIILLEFQIRSSKKNID